ncbi:MAG: SRPBCC domain-containing protein [Bacteroidia bacterium]
MKKLLFDFTVDKPAKTVHITREFDAPLLLVWEAFTTKEILDQWTAPAPWHAKTKHMNFQVGGKRFYAMIGPEGQERWIIQTYTSITPTSGFKLLNAFADKDEKPELPGSEWDYHFSEENGITKVNITVFNESFERMDSLLEGFKQGYIKALENLDGFLSAKKIPANRTVSITLPVKDLQRSVNFYTALGFENYTYTTGDTVKYLLWSEHISLILMSREKFASHVPKPLADTKQTMASFFTLSVSSLDELNSFMAAGLNAGGVEPTEKDDYAIMQQRTLEDFDGHCWNVLFIDRSKISAEQQTA